MVARQPFFLQLKRAGSLQTRCARSGLVTMWDRNPSVTTFLEVDAKPGRTLVRQPTCVVLSLSSAKPKSDCGIAKTGGDVAKPLLLVLSHLATLGTTEQLATRVSGTPYLPVGRPWEHTVLFANIGRSQTQRVAREINLR